MHISQVKRRQKLIDRWYPDWGIARVKAVLKTRVRLLFPGGRLLTYDKAHVQFLERPSQAR